MDLKTPRDIVIRTDNFNEADTLVASSDSLILARIHSSLATVALALLSMGAPATPTVPAARSGISVAQSPADDFIDWLQYKSLDDVRAAIAQGLDPNATTRTRRPWMDFRPVEAPGWIRPGTTVLNFAIDLKRFDVATLLIELGADVNKPDDTPEALRPLQTLARTDSTCCQASDGGVARRQKLDEAALELTTMLLTRGAVLDTRDGVGYSAVDYAALADNVPVLGRLMAAGAPIDGRKPRRTLSNPGQSTDGDPFYGLPGATPLILAVHVRARRTTNWLVEHHANVNAATDDGLTPLLIAVADADAEAVTLLLDHGADVNQAAPKMRPPYNLTPVRLAQYLVDGHPEFLDIVPLLTGHGAELDIGTRAADVVRRAFYHCCYLPVSH